MPTPFGDISLAVPVVVRLEAWRIALDDAASYLELLVRVANEDRADRDKATLYKGLNAAAILSVCQLLVPGSAGPNISANNEPVLQDLLERLCDHSDDANGWRRGATRGYLEAARRQRHQLLAHFDGMAADVTLPEGPDFRIIWQSPNSSFRFTGYDGLRQACRQMSLRLGEILEIQRRNARPNDGDHPCTP